MRCDDFLVECLQVGDGLLRQGVLVREVVHACDDEGFGFSERVWWSGGAGRVWMCAWIHGSLLSDVVDGKIKGDGGSTGGF